MTVQIVDCNGVVDPSAMALTEFPFDDPMVSKSMQNCIFYSNKWTENLSGILIKKQKSLPDDFVETDIVAKFVFRFDNRNASKNMKYGEKYSILRKTPYILCAKNRANLWRGSLL